MKQMRSINIAKSIQQTSELLLDEINNGKIKRKSPARSSMPSLPAMKKIMEVIKTIFFPGYLSEHCVREELLDSFITIQLEELYDLLFEQIQKGFCYQCENIDITLDCNNCEEVSEKITLDFISHLPLLKKTINNDVIAAYNGDPAAKNYAEIIYCYPVIKSLIHHRVAHSLYQYGVPIIPRIISEMAHASTGIDIHPGAKIGEYFTIDHGTGVVIGETSIIGNNVKIYQGVTLGAKSFPVDKDGKPIKGIERHPIIEDNVVIYANATILGRITIGKNAIIGANVWIVENVKENSKVFISPDNINVKFKNGI